MARSLQAKILRAKEDVSGIRAPAWRHVAAAASCALKACPRCAEAVSNAALNAGAEAQYVRRLYFAKREGMRCCEQACRPCAHPFLGECCHNYSMP